ncbi:MAG: hypothetical protein CM1200mP41_14120 [Gammaproteobacteria bacterium]|nr:MAG: hypothetical protein CM1200mP41_14120 [Gammaproteobacteria bacterium]
MRRSVEEKVGAMNGTLTIMIGGPKRHSIVAEMCWLDGKNLIHAGDEVGMGGRV